MALSDEIHDKLTNDDTSDAGDGDEIGSEQDVPRSFTLILISSFLTKLGDAIASPKTTLAWVSTAVGAPAYVLGFLVPLRESGSMIPQLFIGGAIRQLPVRKWVWVLGSCGQFLCVVGLGLTAWLLEGKAAGWMMLLLVTLFSLARGFSSVASKDVLGKTIPRKQRGQLTGWATSAAGLLSIAVGVVLLLPVTGRLDESLLGVLLVGAGLLWLVAAAVYSQVPEPVGETGGGRNAVEALRRLNILVSDKPFRRFVITRALLMCSALSAPFYVALAQQNYGSPAYLLGAFVISAGVASLVSAPFWGRLADWSSRTVMAVAALIAGALGVLAVAVEMMLPALAGQVWFYPLVFFVLMVAHSGVRLGRKTYVVDLADGNRRTDYVAVSNSVIGVVRLLLGGMGALAQLLSVPLVILAPSVLGLAGAAMSRLLPEVT